jgi:hypothetical protein
MSIGMYGRLVDSHQAELHRVRRLSPQARPAAAHVAEAGQAARGAATGAGWTGSSAWSIRRRLGVALVEAGLHLMGPGALFRPASEGKSR